ncbi:hypothetical protein FHU40_003731 [Nocardioides soli]|uniref:Uncharacterized protein n=1 Tax=Nocardioides soli TaxID=1036020 RepID=A0A7W4VY46_9ACTN|nr:hypothetical protein [Nocardioides soli]
MRTAFVALAVAMAAYDRGRRRGRLETIAAHLKIARAER